MPPRDHINTSENHPAHQILVADMDVRRSATTRAHLERAGYKTALTKNGVGVLAHVQREPIDLLVLDHGLPYMDPGQIVEAVRDGSDASILMTGVPAKDGGHHTVPLQADDYVGMGCSGDQLITKARRLIARVRPPKGRTAQISLAGCMTIDLARKTVSIDDREVLCTHAELAILAALAATPNVPLDRTQILPDESSAMNSTSSRIVDMHMSHLRKKLEVDPRRPKYLLTIRGVGYMLRYPRRYGAGRLPGGDFQ
jgi:DNA-binding response OmpR family regulator